MPNRSSDNTPRKIYPLHQCALYKLRSRRRLASLLGLSPRELIHLTRRSDNYRRFYLSDRGGKRRLVEWPKPHMERIHRRVLRLLQRVESPGYLHSGVKSCSYITNARQHIGASALATLDIKAFYPSTTMAHVQGFCRTMLGCSPDVAELLAKLLTCDGHVPTGGCASQIVAFYSHKQMFDEIYRLAADRGITMTCYVDDLTFSGEELSGKFLYEVKKRIHGRGLRYHKEKRYLGGRPKLVTGVVVSGDAIEVPNKLHLSIYQDFLRLENCEDAAALSSLLARLVGRCNAGRQIDVSFERRVHMCRELGNQAIKALA